MRITYDNRSRVTSVTDVFGQVVSYAYDANSNRTQLSLNAATSATYQYDAINRLTTLTDAASLPTTFSYDVTDKLTSRTLPNGVVTTSQYDDLNRLTRLTHAKAGNTLADFQYQLNAINNITQMIDNANKIANRGQACDFAILWSLQLSRLDPASDDSTNSQSAPQSLVAKELLYLKSVALKTS